VDRIEVPPGKPDTRRSAFTIIELLIVVGIIIILLSIIVVAMNAAVRTSQGANTQALLSSINNASVAPPQACSPLKNPKIVCLIRSALPIAPVR
jgi:hypothetical protein